jgi:hypothetical protein
MRAIKTAEPQAFAATRGHLNVHDLTNLGLVNAGSPLT